MFRLENNISAENIVEAQRESLLQIARRLEALAIAIFNKPSKSALKTLSEEAFSIRKDTLKAIQDLLDRCRPALTPEQYSLASTQVADYLSKALEHQSNINLNAENLELLNLESNKTGESPKQESADHPKTENPNNTPSQPESSSTNTPADARTSDQPPPRKDSVVSETRKNDIKTTPESTISPPGLKSELSRPPVPKLTSARTK